MNDKELLLQYLCSRLPSRPLGKINEEYEGRLIGIDLKDPERPLISVLLPGFKSPCVTDLYNFRINDEQT